MSVYLFIYPFFQSVPADVAAGPIFITDNRREVVDFTSAFMDAQATLLLRRPPNGADLRVRDLADLVDRQTEIGYGTLRRGIIPRTFRRTNDSLLRRMWRNMQRQGAGVFTPTNEDGVARVRRDRFAFVLPDTIGEYIALRRPCEFVTLGRFLLVGQGYGLALRRQNYNRRRGGSLPSSPSSSSSSSSPQRVVAAYPLLDAFNGALRTLKETGYLDKLKYTWWAARSQCHNGVRSSMMYSRNSASADKHRRCRPVHVTVAILFLYVVSFGY